MARSTPRPPVTARPRARPGDVAAVLTGVVLVAAGTLGPWAPPGGGASASAILGASRAAAAGQSSVHYVDRVKTGSTSVTITGDVATTEGSQTIVVNGGGKSARVSIILVGGTAYFRGDALGLAGFMGLPAALAVRNAGRWIAVPRTDRAFATIAAGLTTASAVAQVSISPPFSLHGTSRKVGQRVVALGGLTSGAPPGSATPINVPVVLYVAASGRPLPVLYTAAQRVSGREMSQSVSFAKWREPVHVRAPAQPIPVGSLGASPTEA